MLDSEPQQLTASTQVEPIALGEYGFNTIKSTVNSQ